MAGPPPYSYPVPPVYQAVHMRPTVLVVEEAPEHDEMRDRDLTPPWICTFVLSLFGCLLCCPLGFFAVVLALLALVTHEVDYRGANATNQLALCLAITAVVLGIIMIPITLLILSTLSYTHTWCHDYFWVW